MSTSHTSIGVLQVVTASRIEILCPLMAQELATCQISTMMVLQIYFCQVITVAKVYLITIFTGEMQQTATMIKTGPLGMGTTQVAPSQMMSIKTVISIWSSRFTTHTVVSFMARIKALASQFRTV